MARQARPKITGISVYQRGRTWSYRLDLGDDPLSGTRSRANKGGYDTQEEAWKAALDSQA